MSGRQVLLSQQAWVLLDVSSYLLGFLLEFYSFFSSASFFSFTGLFFLSYAGISFSTIAMGWPL
jgi:hypothetical protein